MEHVSSRQNAVVKRFRDIARAGRIGDDVLLDGAHLVGEARAAGIALDVVAFAADTAQGRLAPLAADCMAGGARVITAPDSVLTLMSPVRQHSGVIAIARLRPATIESAIAAGSPALVLLLDRIQDPGNVGAIIRSAEACGATAVITGPGTADPFGWKALRGSMGSAFRLPVAAAASLDAPVAAARDAGLHIFATVARGGTPLDRASLAGPAMILLGGEGPGLSDEMLERADERLTIAMRAPVESLNVSVAAALIVYEASRQRTHVAI
ncbi:MAG: RNA methyltransferase [Vicinamibacterales bacterium]